jgi:CRP-like cAMP-binding protein
MDESPAGRVCCACAGAPIKKIRPIPRSRISSHPPPDIGAILSHRAQRDMIAIMSGTTAELLSKLKGRDANVAAGKIVFRAGDPIRSLFLVKSGTLRLVRTLPHLQLTVQRAGAGAILAEASLFAGFADRYHCDAVASEYSVLRVVPLREVRAALSEDSPLALALARDLSVEVQRVRAHAEILSLKTVAKRLDAWMALYGDPLPTWGRWLHVASDIGVTPEALYRELALRRSRGHGRIL